MKKEERRKEQKREGIKSTARIMSNGDKGKFSTSSLAFSTVTLGKAVRRWH